MADTRSPGPADLWLERWLAEKRAGREPVLESFLARAPGPIREELRELILDHQALAEAVAEEGPAFEEGQVIGDFRLVRELGHGAMGTVWEAEQLSLRRKLALKLLKPQLGLSTMFLNRFRREAQAAGRLQHPGIVQVFGMGESEGFHWIAQELVPGGRTLADRIAERRDAADLPAGWYFEMAELFAKLADALEYAHQNGIVHRDIKPSNILIGIHDHPRIADFGLAQVQDDLGLSRTGDFLGTPFYMSPEQALSKRMGLDHRSDIFSLGATLYEVLTLVRAFDGDTSQQVFQKIVTEDPVDPRVLRSQVPQELAVIAGKCLEKSPDRRYASMAELAADLRRHLNHEPILARPAGTLRRGAKWCRRHPVVAVGGVITLLSFVAISWLAWRLSSERTQAAVNQLAMQEQVEAARNENREAGERESALREELEALRLRVEEAGAGESAALEQAGARLARAREGMQASESAAAGARKALADRAIAQASLALGDFRGAEAALLRTLEESAAIPSLARADALGTLGVLYLNTGRADRAKAALESALELCRAELAEDEPVTLTVQVNLALACIRANQPDEAVPILQEALEARRRVLGENHPATQRVEQLLASLQRENKGR